MHDHRPGGRASFADDIGLEIVFDPAQRKLVRFLRFLDLVEDADRGHRVVGRVDDVIAHEARDAADDRHEILDLFGQQVGFFHKFAGREYEDKRPLYRYRDEAKRILAVLEGRLVGRAWIMGDDYTIADISMLGWVRNLIGFYDAGELVDFGALKSVPAWLERGLARPAVQRGLNIPKRE